MKIEENKLVTLEYRLFVKNEQGEMELMEEATPENQLQFFYGLGMMLPAFEAAIAGLKAGDTFKFTIPTDEAYGAYDEENIVELPRNIFEVDGKIDTEKIHTGAIVPLMDADNNRINVEVVEIKDSGGVVDFNHPLAGEDLYFEGKVISVEQPSEEQLQALLSHSCGCGGGCSSGCDSDCSSSGCGGGCQ